MAMKGHSSITGLFSVMSSTLSGGAYPSAEMQPLKDSFALRTRECSINLHTGTIRLQCYIGSNVSFSLCCLLVVLFWQISTVTNLFPIHASFRRWHPTPSLALCDLWRTKCWIGPSSEVWMLFEVAASWQYLQRKGNWVHEWVAIWPSVPPRKVGEDLVISDTINHF